MSLDVDQTLHGYRDGHELLATSMPVPRQVRRALLTMSDLSGTGFVPEFDGYLTGYPLAEAAKYALARTWYADEMERPGCVWTHTLLVDFSDIAELESLETLLALFRRPKPAKSFRKYEKRLEIGASASLPSSHPVDCSTAILSALYAGDEAPLLVSGDRVGEHDELIASIWSQQWPRLRRAFSFCTGSFSLRTIDQRPLDLQVVPKSRWARVVRTDPSAHVVADVDCGVDDDCEEWLVAASADFKGKGTPLRSFLRTYGGDVPGRRPSFQRLTQCFLALEGLRRRRISLGQMLSVVCGGFPGPSEAARLKKELLAPESAGDAGLGLGVSEGDRILAALDPKLEPAFHLQGLDLRDRASHLIRLELGGEGGRGFLLRLLNSGEGEVNASAVRQLLSDVDATQLNEILERDEALFRTVLHASYRRLYAPETWMAPRHLQRKCIEQVAGESHSSVSIPKLVSAAVAAGPSAAARDLHRVWGDEPIWAALDWIEGDPRQNRTLMGEWIELVRENPGAVGRWLGHADPVATLSLLGCILQPTEASLSDLSTKRLSEWATRASGAGEATDTLALLLAIGLGRKDEDACSLVCESFAPVHSALLADNLGWQAWTWLEPLVPSRYWFFSREWDRADKLRRALLTRVESAGWPASCLRTAAGNDSRTREYFTTTARESSYWTRVIREAFV